MRNRKYFLDINDLQYKQVRLPWKRKILRIVIWFAATVVITIFYGTVFENVFGSPKERVLNKQVDNLKFQYDLANRELNNSARTIESLKMSDEVRYRPILEMDSLPDFYRNPGFGGIDRFNDLNGYMYTDLMKSMKERIEEMKNILIVQGESFKAVEEKSTEWKRMWEYMPRICPVTVTIRRGDGVKFRDVHPVWGTPQWHHGQDFYTPYGTDVYATGNGKVIQAGWNSGGFGNYVVIDHGYGFQTTYGHLSSIKVTKNQNVKRGELLGLTGDSGTSSGPHLHYQIDLYGQHKNPLEYLNDDMTEDEYFEMIRLLTTSTKFR
jgi:murein DD-endopeptidase MepM/ murein hydrolase activator NlpD